MSEQAIAAALEQDAVIGIVDDDADFSALLASQSSHLGYRCETYSSGEELLDALSRKMFAAVLLDLTMPGVGGMATLRSLRERVPYVPVIMVTADEDVDTVVECMRAGAYDYITKPVPIERLETALRHSFEKHRLTIQVLQLSREAGYRSYAGMVGRSEAILRVQRMMDRVAATDISVLIRGESGTGKELVARGIHQRSSRANGPFVALNSAAIPETLLEAELFGHEKGAFTGAVSRRLGKIEEANGGTLFLDEIGELPLGMQSKLLRVIQERQFQRIGGSALLNADFRLIAATHRNLPALVRTGEFREDLYFRIAVFDIEVPPLRDRGSDILVLATKFIEEYRASTRSPARSLSPGTAEVLRAYDWPGNVRELQNTIQRALVLCEGDEILPEHLPSQLSTRVRRTTQLRDESKGAVARNASSTMDEIERSAIEDCILQARGNVSEAMRLLKMGRNRFYRKLKKYDLMDMVERMREKS